MTSEPKPIVWAFSYPHAVYAYYNGHSVFMHEGNDALLRFLQWKKWAEQEGLDVQWTESTHSKRVS